MPTLKKETPGSGTAATSRRRTAGANSEKSSSENMMNAERATLAFSEAVLVNPPSGLKSGQTYPFVDMAAVSSGQRDVSASEVREFKGSGSRFKARDTLMARITPCLENGKIARYLPNGEEELGHGSTEFIVIRGRPGVTDNDYAYYLTISPQVRNFAISQMTGTSGRQRVPTEALNKLTVSLPPLPEQKRIAHILGTLDDKIELNRRMNATLEAMARALFKSWFVDSIPEDGSLPEGWEWSTIGEEAKVVGGSTPSTKDSEFWESGEFHWVTPKDFSSLQSKVLINSSRKITQAGVDQISSGLLPKNTVLLSSRAPVGYLALTKIRTAINQGFIAMICQGRLSPEYVLLWAESILDKIIQAASGTTFAEISKATFRPFPILVPAAEKVSEFTNIVRPYFDLIAANERQSIGLAETRDELLPMLLSGELQAEDASHVG